MSVSPVKNEKGIALLTALLYTLLALGIIMVLLYMITQSTKTTAANKSYKNALEASYGATDVLAKDLFPTIFNQYTSASSIRAFASGSTFAGIGFAVTDPNCFARKTTHNTSSWNDSGGCTEFTTVRSPEATVKPDLTFNLRADNDNTGFKVYAKIVDTRCGGDPNIPGQKCSNSDSGGIPGLDVPEGVAGLDDAIPVMRKPAYYRLEVQGERAANPRERAKLSVLYAY